MHLVDEVELTLLDLEPPRHLRAELQRAAEHVVDGEIVPGRGLARRRDLGYEKLARCCEVC